MAGAVEARGRATMQHVAALAEVSIKTVSRVVNGEGGVSPERERRVREAMARLGYRHNLAASNLRRGLRTASIGVLLQDVGNDYCGELLRAIDARARERGVVVMSASLDEEPERERELVAGLVARRIDGLVLMPATDDQSYLVPELQAGLPIVVVDRAPRGIAVDSVTSDNREGSALAVGHLAAHGHRRIAALVDDERIATAHERLAGYREGLGRASLAADEHLVVTGVRSEESAREHALRLLAGDDPPTAFFTARNVATVGVVRALRDLGRSREVALVGFDDFPTADLLDPGVTCVQQPVHDQGDAAIDMLLARIDGEQGLPRSLVVSTRLVQRGSGELPGPGA